MAIVFSTFLYFKSFMLYNILMENIENKSRVSNIIFYTVFILLILGSVGFTFWRIVIQKDYQIVSETSCDPVTESCFHYDAVVCDEGDTACVASDAYDYKKISKKAASIYACEQTEEKTDCTEELSCLEDEEDCSYTLCDPENLAEGEVCAETPVAEEVSEVVESTEITESTEIESVQ